MAATQYSFRNFQLDTQARELRRDGQLLALPVSTLDCLIYLIRNRNRTVGRDELTAAVWGRVVISEVSLSHAVMRLRRLLSDKGNEQTSIRTLPRLGYRWIVEPTIEIEVKPVVTGDAESAVVLPKLVLERIVETGESAEQPHREGRIARSISLVAVCIVIALLAVALLPANRRLKRVIDNQSLSINLSAIVLPAQIDASDEWSWLRIGLMDLINNHLVRGGIVTMPSETVYNLDNAHRLGHAENPERKKSSAIFETLTIYPHAALVSGLWNVTLSATMRGHELIAEAQAKDIVTAGRAVADDFLLKLGRLPPKTEETEPSVAAEELMEHVHTAALTGHLEVAAALIKNIPHDEENSPEIKLSAATIELFSGEYDASLRHAQSILDQLPVGKSLQLRARVYNLLGSVNVRLNRNENADHDFVEAIRILEPLHDPDRLATAYTGRGVVAAEAHKMTEAAVYFGRARTLHEVGNDTYGVARADLNLGIISIDRGYPAEAVPVLEMAATTLAGLSTPEPLNTALGALADAQSDLVEHEHALATTDRFWPVETHSRNAREGWWLTLSRASQLVANGRLREADDLVESVRAMSDRKKDDVVRLENEALAAQIALLRDDNRGAAALAAGAMTPLLQRTNWHDYAVAWLTRIRGLQRSDQIATAAGEVTAFAKWVDRAPNKRHQVYVALAQADQAYAEGNRVVATRLYSEAAHLAEQQGIPDDIVNVAEPYVGALLDSGQVERAAKVADQVSQWSGKDMRAAWIQAAVYRALGNAGASLSALERARSLAGDRRLPDLPLRSVAMH